MIQTASRKQWNLVVLNLNGLAAWIKKSLNKNDIMPQNKLKIKVEALTRVVFITIN